MPNKVLSLLQPWASLVIAGVKCFEVRSWQTQHRGSLWIHASSGKPSRRERLFFEQSAYFSDYIKDMQLLPYGAIIGQVSLVQIVATDWLIQNMEQFPEVPWNRELAFDDFGPGRFAWQLAAPEAFQNCIPIKGRLGLWEY